MRQQEIQARRSEAWQGISAIDWREPRYSHMFTAAESVADPHSSWRQWQSLKERIQRN